MNDIRQAICLVVNPIKVKLSDPRERFRTHQCIKKKKKKKKTCKSRFIYTEMKQDEYSSVQDQH